MAALVLAGAGAGAFFLLRGGSGDPPASVEALRELLVDPAGWPTGLATAGRVGGPNPDTIVSTATTGPEDLSNADGQRWSVNAYAPDSAGAGTNLVGLAQYDTAEHALAALEKFRAPLRGSAAEETVAGRPNAYVYAEVGFGGDRPAQVAMAVKGTVVVILSSVAETPPSLRRLLGDQLDRLP